MDAPSFSLGIEAELPDTAPAPDSTATPLEGSGENQAVAATSPEPIPAPAEGEAEGSRGPVFSWEAMAKKGKWAEQLMSQVCLPEVQQDFAEHGSAAFFRDAFSSAFWVSIRKLNI